MTRLRVVKNKRFIRSTIFSFSSRDFVEIFPSLLNIATPRECQVASAGAAAAVTTIWLLSFLISSSSSSTAELLCTRKIQMRNSKIQKFSIHFHTSIDHRFEVSNSKNRRESCCYAEMERVRKYYRIFVFLKDYSNYSLSFKNNKCVLRDLDLIFSSPLFCDYSPSIYQRSYDRI